MKSMVTKIGFVGLVLAVLCSCATTVLYKPIGSNENFDVIESITVIFSVKASVLGNPTASNKKEAYVRLLEEAKQKYQQYNVDVRNISVINQTGALGFESTQSGLRATLAAKGDIVVPSGVRAVISAAKEADEQALREQREQEEARRQARIKEEAAEQERLANLYRQAGNNYGNLRNTSKMYGTAFGTDYITKIYNFGDGSYIEQTTSVLGLSFRPETGNYRVNGDMVIFLSSEGEYSYGTIVGTALRIGSTVYR